MTQPEPLKVAVIGAGAVGAACLLSLAERGVAREVTVINRTRRRAEAVALDMGYGAPLTPHVDIRAGGYDDAAGANLVMITSGVKEAEGGATDRSDQQGRLRLLEPNAEVYREIVPEVVMACPDATIMVVTDPPDPLAALTRHLAGHNRVFSTGTVLDSMRFQVHLARHLNVRPSDVHALVVGEHGTSHVPLWSSATVAGVPVLELLARGEEPVEKVREQIEEDIRFANITIIDGIGASQYGIGRVSARLAQAVLRDEREILPIAAHSEQYGTTLSLPWTLGRDGAGVVYEPGMTSDERAALERSANVLREATARVL